jgi:CDP-diacylglycerol pyrophosphatase
MRHIESRFWLLAAALLGATVSAASLAGGNERDRLREIIQQQCVPHWLHDQDPAPCLSVTLDAGSDFARGSAVLPDRKGGAHFLLIPLESVSGIESSALWAPGALNYFQAAWAARFALTKIVGREVPRNAVGLAVNSRSVRSQDQLHIHLECLRQRVHEALAASAESLGSNWASIDIVGGHYQALRVMGADLGETNPFKLLAERLPGPRETMGAYTLVVAGMDFKEGPGFAVLASQSSPGGELLLDSSCALVP